jgi:hypothetical protein
MPLEVRELVVKVDVGTPPTVAPRQLDRQEIAKLKREVVAACLAELRRQTATTQER